VRCPSARLVALWAGIAGILPPPRALAVEAEGRYRLVSEGALRVHDPIEPTRLRARSEVEFRVRQGFTWRGTVAVRAFRDWALDRSRYSAAAREQQGGEVELRELTIGVAVGPLDLVAGRRQVAWGALFGQFVTDRVMPLDLRDFVLPDADFVRRPLWMVSLLAAGERLSAEALLVLERRADRLPVAGSEFALDGAGAVGAGEEPAGAAEENDVSRVALGDSEPALRLEGRAGGVDVTAFALAAHPDLDPTATSGELGERDLVIGSTAAVASGPYALRTEAVLERDRPRATGGSEDVVRAGLAVDRALPRAHIVSLQCVHESVGDGRTEVALRWSGAPAGGRLVPSVEFHLGLDGDWLLKPRAAYSIGTAWLAEFGVDGFGGRPDTFYGQFDRRDRVTLTISRAGRWATATSKR